MLSRNDLYLLSFFRANARKPLTRISRETSMPVSTIFDKLKRYEGSLIKKHTCLIDFKKLGFEIRVGMLLKAFKEKRQQLQEFLMNHHRVNTLLRVTSGYDYFVEALFRNMEELQEFGDRIEEMGIEDRKDLFIIDEVKREDFMSHPEYIDIILHNL